MIDKVYRERRYTYVGQWFAWFEECPVISETNLFVTVRSQTYATINYPGGDFRLDKENLLRSGKKYHSRHGECFYLEKPRQGDLFPSEELLKSPSFLMQEAASMGWDTSLPIHQWNEWQKLSWLHATFTKGSLKQSVGIWKSSGIGGLEQAIAQFHKDEMDRMMLVIEMEK